MEPAVKPSFILLPAGLGDLNALRRLEQVCFGVDAWPWIDLFGVLTLPGITRIKAEVNDVMVGFIAGDTNPWEGIGWITTLGVDPNFRRQGVAELLLAECERKLNQPRLRLSVRKSNEPAIRLYAKHGYSQLETWPHYYQGGEDALVLEKKRPDANTF